MKTLNQLWNFRAVIFLSLCFLANSASPAAALRPEKLAEMDQAIIEAIGENKCPGGVLWVEHQGTSYQKAFGNRAVVPAREKMTEDTIFDAASLTKVVACTPAVMLLVERGKIGLEDKVTKYIPEFGSEGKGGITVRQLLTHTSGLRPDVSLKPDWDGYDVAIKLACAEKLSALPGEKVIYSDTGMYLLGEIVHRVSGVPLDQFVKREIYDRLGMKDTGFNPPQTKLARIAPTEVENGVPVRGVVHDPRARRMAGVAGHAGLFFTASDLARYARMILQQGELDGVRIFKPETVKLMTSVQTPPGVTARRGLGWDIDSSYSGPRGKVFPLGSFGHTGWTGTSLWIDPFSKSFVIFLSNRNHPTEKGSVIALRAKLGTLAAEAIADFDFTNVPGVLPPQPGKAESSSVSPEPVRAAAEPLSNPTPVRVTSKSASPSPIQRLSSPRDASVNRAAPYFSSRRGRQHAFNGIDVLVKNNFAPLKGKRVGLITNHTGQDRDRNPTIDLLKAAPGVTLAKLFSPEHGIRGALDEKVGDARDEKTGLPILSLYGETRKPTAAHLMDLDALVYDIQDIGCRFYTYPSTMGLAIEAAAENGKQIFVLDRVNPITGTMIDGPVLAEKPTFVGFYQVPLRHGMTLGELARMYNAEKNLKADLTVIEVERWRRDQWYDQTGLPWSNPSPNMRNLKQAILYPGVGLLESALSVGRGTDTPFEVVGAPYIDDVRLAEELNRAKLPGVSFVPVRFTPTYSVHKGTNCGGVYIMLNDRDRCNVVDVGLQIARTLCQLYPDNFNLDKTKHLLLHAPTLAAVKANTPLNEIRASWKADVEKFQKRRQKYLIYK